MNMKQIKLTEKENELIVAIRNFKSSKHNYSLELEWFIRQLFETLLYDDDKN
ncbi:hypothetical protein [Arachidicoccus ginsenosidimutans]|uniref:hypothetical protein n=1 Tax=Arachidicoccus sp. BS20 TaxID=1850526 RepID=UPI0018D43A32|nr:hypothetical protein [Arachidicoccus sp. BS20]